MKYHFVIYPDLSFGYIVQLAFDHPALERFEVINE